MEVEPYTEDAYYDDLMRVTEDMADPDLALLLVRESQPTVRWMRDLGIRWIPMFGRQAYKVGNRFRFWGGLVLEAVGGGPGLIDMEYASAARAGIDVRFEAKASALATDASGRVTGVIVRTPVAPRPSRRRPSCSRREASRPTWRCARVTSAPTGTSRASAGLPTTPATPFAWPSIGRPALGPLERLSLRGLGLQRALARRPQGGRQLPEALLSARSHRQRARPALRGRGCRLPELHLRQVRPGDHPAAASGRLSDLRPESRAPASGGVPDPRGHQGRGPHDRGTGPRARDRRGRLRSARCASTTPPCRRGAFNPAVKDGKGTRGITPPKSNWAQPLDTPPYVGFAVTTGITFTFGGLRITPSGEVVDAEAARHSRALCRGRAGGWDLLQQLPGRRRSHGRGGIRPHLRSLGGGAAGGGGR